MITLKASILIPSQVTADMIKTGTTVPVVDSSVGEVAWDDLTSYSIGDRVNHVGSIWAALKDHSDIEPGTDPTAWLREGPTNRMAPFDDELNTIARAEGELTYVLQPGFIAGIGLYGLVGEHLKIEYYDEPGGDLVMEYETDLWEQASGLYELLFMPLNRKTQHFVNDMPLYPNPELLISITATNNGPCQVALISVGHWGSLLGSSSLGGVPYDSAEAEVKPYTYRKVEDDGTVTRVRRGAANDINCQVVISADEANYAMDLLHQVQGRPVAFIASGVPRYEYLNGFGDVSGGVRPAGTHHAIVRLRIEGAVQGVRT